MQSAEHYLSQRLAARKIKIGIPYYRDLVRVNIDTGEITTLISSDHEYITVSPKDLMQVSEWLCGHILWCIAFGRLRRGNSFPSRSDARELFIGSRWEENP